MVHSVSSQKEQKLRGLDTLKSVGGGGFQGATLVSLRPQTLRQNQGARSRPRILPTQVFLSSLGAVVTLPHLWPFNEQDQSLGARPPFVSPVLSARRLSSWCE